MTNVKFPNISPEGESINWLDGVAGNTEVLLFPCLEVPT